MAPTGERGRGRKKAAPGARRQPVKGLAQNSEVAATGRGPGRPFKKGKSGNPGGRPKLLAELKEKIQERGWELAEKLFSIALDEGKVKKLGRRFIVDGPTPKERVLAIQTLYAYGYGKPVQAVELSGPGGGPVQTHATETMTSGERRKRIAELLGFAAQGQAAPESDTPPADGPDTPG